MNQPGTVIESELLDLTGVTLEELRAYRNRERDEIEQRLLHDLGHPVTSLADHTA